MSWRDQYQPGSFRGAAFVTINHEHSGGRRVVTFEYPGRDEPSIEDMGRRAREYRLDLYVIGGDYFADRNALLSALEAEGAGLLIHPWLGSLQVAARDFSQTESTDEGGMARFQVTFIESGLPVTNSQQADANALAIDAADTAVASAASSFADRFTISAMPGFVEDAAGSLIGEVGTLASTIASGSGAGGTLLSAFGKSLDYLDNLPALMRAPESLGGSLVTMVQATVAVAGSDSARKAIAACNRLADMVTDVPLFATPARLQQGANADAVLHLVRHVALAELVRTVAATDYSSRDAANAVRDASVAKMDDLALAAADAGEDARVRDFDTLRRALVADLAQRVPGLPRLQSYTPRATEPALVIANRLYGHASAASMADSIAAAGNPAFVAGGIALEVLTRV